MGKHGIEHERCQGNATSTGGVRSGPSSVVSENSVRWEVELNINSATAALRYVIQLTADLRCTV